MHNFHRSSFRLARESLHKKILLCEFTRARDIIRWYLGKALGSNLVTGSASSHRRHSQPISTPRWINVAYYFQRSTFSCSVVRRRGACLTWWLNFQEVQSVSEFSHSLFSSVEKRQQDSIEPFQRFSAEASKTVPQETPPGHRALAAVRMKVKK
jgi:hypothetical protein